MISEKFVVWGMYRKNIVLLVKFVKKVYRIY